MRPLVRLLAGIVLLISAVAGMQVLVSTPATAGCAGSSAEDADTSDVAFSGVVTASRETGDDVITTVRVDRVFKGEVTRRVDVVSSAEGADYSVHAGSGDRLIVFGDLVEGEVTSSACRSVSEPDEESYGPILADLGEGTEPAPGYMKAERRTLGLRHEQFVAGRAVLGVLGLSALGYFAYRAWRARRRTT